MFDIGWQELLLIGIVALIVIGPKDMPVAMRTAARMFSKVKNLSREFQNTVSEVMREAELDELRRKVQAAGRINIKDELTAVVDPTGRMREDFAPPADFEDDPPPHVAPVPPRNSRMPAASTPVDSPALTDTPNSPVETSGTGTREVQGAEATASTSAMEGEAPASLTREPLTPSPPEAAAEPSPPPESPPATPEREPEKKA